MPTRKTKHTSPLSFFVHNVSSAEKRKIYTQVLKEAAKEQLEMIEAAKALKPK